MLNERRKNKRFDTSLVVEFKSLKKSINSYLGITRDFSCDGFSFDSQSSWIEPGDSLELTFKNPHSGSYFSGLGEIVWKKKANNFEFITGIKFKSIDKSAKRNILEMAAAAGDVPGDYIPCDKRGKNSRIKKGNSRWYAAVIIIAFLSLVIAPRIFEEKESEMNPPLAVPTIIEQPHEIETQQPVDTPDDAPAVRTEYYVQAGAWKNPEYAREMFEGLRRYYPELYIVVKNDFQIIRIPGIKDKEQGAAITRDIEDKFNLKPILVMNK